MSKERDDAVRNAGLILVRRAGFLLSGLLFAALVPRLMRPHGYGRYALLFAIAM